ncbi:MAG TPA: glucuronate isomerase [Candidatus Kryptonia bacterium]
MKKSILNEYRFFDSDPVVRKIAFDLYSSVRNLPIISPHGHVDPATLADNLPFPDPTELIIIPDHYIYRMLYSRGIPLESLGIPSSDGARVETDHRKIWQTFADNYYLFAGTPTGIWLTHEFVEVFGINEILNSKNAMKFYDKINNKLQTPKYLPRALFEKFKIEVLTTTDSPSDSLKFHWKIRESGLKGKVVPCFRPDALINITKNSWKAEIDALGAASGIDVSSYKNFIRALENRREYFKSMGAVSTDHGVESPYTHRLPSLEAEDLFKRALKCKATDDDLAAFTPHMLMEMARMSSEDGLVMQIHAGAFRNHNAKVFERFGSDRGGDIPVRTEFTRNLHDLLNEFGNNPDFTMVVFTLDESAYSRELAPLAGHYPGMKLGASWWFHDSIGGMRRYRDEVTETAGFYNTVGFTDDTRAFLSIPARHDLARRMDSNFLAGLVARHILSKDDARKIGMSLAYDLAKKTYKL